MFIFAPKDALQLAVRLGLIFGKQGSSLYSYLSGLLAFESQKHPDLSFSNWSVWLYTIHEMI